MKVIRKILSRVHVFTAFFVLAHIASAQAGGTVVAWGGNNVGQTNACATNVVAIATGYEQNVLLKSDGTVANCGMHFETSDYPIVVPSPLTDVKAIAGGWAHSMALKSNGTVVVWGRNTSGQTNVPAGLTNVIAISAADDHCLALVVGGSLIGWGAGRTSIPLMATNVVAIAAGSVDLALRADGTVVGWGIQGTNYESIFAGLTNIVGISSGYDFGSLGTGPEWLALRADGKLLGHTLDSMPADLTNIVAMCASSGTDHHVNLAVRSDGTVVGWGFAFYPPLVVPGLTNVIAVSSDSSHSLALIGDAPPSLEQRIENPQFGNEGFKVSVHSQSGRVYRLEYKDSLEGNNWTALPLAAGTGDVLTLVDPAVPSQQRFYRVRQW